MSSAAEIRLREKYNWKKIEVPKTWRPTDVEELVGYYGGRTLKNGSHGQYEVIIVHVPYKGAMIVSGTALITLVDAALIAKGDPIRIRYLGLEQLKGDREMKKFELFIAEGERVAEEELPEVRVR